MKLTPPLRFVALVLTGWIGARGAVIYLDRVGPRAPGLEPATAAVLPAPRASGPAHAIARTPLPPPPSWISSGPRRASSTATSRRHSTPTLPSDYVRAATSTSPTLVVYDATPAPVPSPIPAVIAPYPQAVRPALPPRAGRWSASAWLLVRDDGAVPLATTGVLGGSQVGARVAYRLNGDASRPISLFARASAALRQSASETAIGVEWRPSARLPIQLAVEHRVRVAGAGRTDLAVFAHGGGTTALSPRLRLDVYGQAGLVGAEERDAFADGATRLTTTVGSGIEAGLGVWGGAQPGAARLDVGPTVSVPFRIGPANMRASADWRFRVAGDARPDSGPALTLGVDF